jgi:tetrahydromethanopterin S-methyltransferase subunit D
MLLSADWDLADEFVSWNQQLAAGSSTCCFLIGITGNLLQSAGSALAAASLVELLATKNDVSSLNIVSAPALAKSAGIEVHYCNICGAVQTYMRNPILGIDRVVVCGVQSRSSLADLWAAQFTMKWANEL